MIYLDHGATSFHKPPEVCLAMCRALQTCANPGRGGYEAAMEAGRVVFACREEAAALFHCKPEQVVFTSSCTHGLNMAIRTLVPHGGSVLITGFEHNAVTRPLHLLGADIRIAGRKLFDWENTLAEFERELRRGVDAAIFTHVSNVFGYILPVEQMAALCHQYKTPFLIDAAQSAGILSVDMDALGADFIAMPGHKGLLGPQGTGILLCGRLPKVLFAGGTGSDSRMQLMPEYLPDRGEAGTLNVPGIAGLSAGIHYIRQRGTEDILRKEHWAAAQAVPMLMERGYQVFSGEHQSGTVSFVPDADCEELAQRMGQAGIAVRAGLHCAPLAHESAGTLQTGTVRLSFGHDADRRQILALSRFLQKRGSES